MKNQPNMFLWKIVALLLLAGVVVVATVQEQVATTIEAYPMVAQVEAHSELGWSQVGAGTILTSRYVLSAAQCFYGKLYSVEARRIRVGSGERNTRGEIFGLDWVLTHPNFGLEGLDSDIALVRLDEPLSYIDAIQPGVIIAAGNPLPADLSVSLVGWGDNELYEDANATYTVTDNALCAGPAADEEDVGGVLTGDVGGPVVYHQEFTSLVVGVVSWRGDCGDSTLPTVASSITKFTEWIVDNAI